MMVNTLSQMNIPMVSLLLRLSLVSILVGREGSFLNNYHGHGLRYTLCLFYLIDHSVTRTVHKL